MANETNIKVLTVQVNTENGQIKIDGLTKGFIKAELAVKKLSATTQSLNKGLDKNIDKTGLAGATVTELGRTISDSNYGIQGMANNLSQLSTLMATLVSTTGGVVNGFKAFWGALMGPLGIIIVIQTLIALWEGYDKKQRAATKSMAEADIAAAKAASNLRVLRSVIDDENLSLNEKNKALKKASEEYGLVNLKLDEFGKLTKESIKQIDDKILAMAREAKARAILDQIEKEYAIQADTSAKNANDFYSVWEMTKSAVLVGLGMNIKATTNLYKAGEKEQAKIMKASKDRLDALLLQLKEEELVDEVFKGKKEKGRRDSNRVYAQILLDLSKIEEKFRQESLNHILRTEEEKIQILKDNAEAEVELSYFVYLEKRQIKLDEFLLTNASEKAKQQARERFAEEEIVALQQLTNVKNQIQAKYFSDLELLDRKRAELARKNVEEIIEIERAKELVTRRRSVEDINEEINLQTTLSKVSKKGSLERAKHELILAKLKEELRQREISDTIEIAEFAIQQLAVVTDFVDSEFQRQLDIEQNKTTALNNELRKRLNNENISKDERKNIQNEIAKNDEELRIKQEKIERKRFIMQKAANIAMSIANTFVAANAVLAQQPGGIISRTTAMIAVIASGLLNVAAIARQQFKGSASTAAGASGLGSRGGSGGPQAPDFNIVGQSPSNQLAAAVKGQFNQPVKAYVVSKDVSTAQEMDRNIVGAASLG